jgi:hypothetical protein
MGYRWGAVVLAVVALGCGQRHGQVSGSVTVDGVPLDYGIVNFVGLDGAASAPILDGAYEAGGVPLGTVRIAVRALPRPVVGAPPAGPVRPYMPLPDRYLSPRDSGLAIEVNAGRQRHDLAVTGT